MSKPQYVPVLAGVPKVVLLDTNRVTFSVSIDPAGCTVLGALANPVDSVAPNSYRLPVNPNNPNFVALPAAGANGLIVLNGNTGIFAALQFSNASNATPTVLQEGLI